jgi:CRISPR system Cascade subunit CasE
VTVWLTRLGLDLRHRAVRQDLRDANAIHHRVMSLLPDDLGPVPRKRAGVLFRVDDTPAGPVILVQTTMRPDPHRLPDGYATAATREITPLLDALRPDKTVHYRIAAKIVALSGVAAERWWQGHAERHGLRLLASHAEPQPPAVGAGTARIRHSIMRFDGQAMVDDPDKVRQAILDGIGRGKSFGCGLLTVAPAR